MSDGRATPTGVALRMYRISSEASAAIEAWAWGIAGGSLRLQQLPEAIHTLYTVSFELGRASRDDEVRQLRLEGDRLWLRSFGEKERLDYLLSRLDRAAELADRADVDDVLDEAWGIYLAGLDNIRQPIALPATTQELQKGAA
ncbi:MAG: hypothetical protein ACQEW8_10745 [Actinomycetota bacterium]